MALLAITPAVPAAQSGSASRPPEPRRSQRVVPWPEITVRSPGNQLAFSVLPNPERLTISVRLGDTPVLLPSGIRWGIDGYDFGAGVTFRGREDFATETTFPWHGAHRTAVDRSRGARLRFVHDLAQAEFTLEVRVFDDGVGYRLIAPGAEGGARVVEELSEFVPPPRASVWFHDLGGHYEAAYQRKPMQEIPAGQWAGPPVTFELPDGAGFGVIAEADLRDYSGLGLECDGRGAWLVGLGHRQPLNYPFELRYGRAEGRRLGRPAAIAGTITTPWRVVLAARDLHTLVNSDVLPSLCPPADPKLFPQGMNTPWVEPGLAVWKYVDGGGPNTLETMQEFSRLGGQLGAKYHILEGFAYGWPDEQIRAFVEFSRRQGVRLLFWRHSRNLRTAAEQDEFFDRLARLGVAGAKIDFFDHEARELVDLYLTLNRKAAERGLVVNYHGANKPSGQLRTWPNEMLREAVRGMESSSLRERARHETILPFTRYLAGPADYTTMIFTERRRDSTWAHQIASLATFHSPMLTLAAHPKSVLENPAVDVIRSIPAVWDETIVLPASRIGELTVFARRRGEMWVLAVMSARLASALEVPLAFLGDGAWRATYVRDDLARPDAVKVETAEAVRGASLKIDLAAGGGFVGRFVRP